MYRPVIIAFLLPYLVMPLPQFLLLLARWSQKHERLLCTVWKCLRACYCCVPRWRFALFIHCVIYIKSIVAAIGLSYHIYCSGIFTVISTALLPILFKCYRENSRRLLNIIKQTHQRRNFWTEYTFLLQFLLRFWILTCAEHVEKIRLLKHWVFLNWFYGKYTWLVLGNMIWFTWFQYFEYGKILGFKCSLFLERIFSFVWTDRSNISSESSEGDFLDKVRDNLPALFHFGKKFCLVFRSISIDFDQFWSKTNGSFCQIEWSCYHCLAFNQIYQAKFQFHVNFSFHTSANQLNEIQQIMSSIEEVSSFH